MMTIYVMKVPLPHNHCCTEGEVRTFNLAKLAKNSHCLRFHNSRKVVAHKLMKMAKNTVAGLSKRYVN